MDCIRCFAKGDLSIGGDLPLLMKVQACSLGGGCYRKVRVSQIANNYCACERCFCYYIIPDEIKRVMKSIFIWSVMTAIFFIMVFICFRGCANFVVGFDGEKKNRMTKIAGNFFYGETDKSIWLLEENTGSYRRIVSDNIDSLVWNNEMIVGCIRGRYFLVSLTSARVNYLRNRSVTLDVLHKGKMGEYKALAQVPSIRMY